MRPKTKKGTGQEMSLNWHWLGDVLKMALATNCLKTGTVQELSLKRHWLGIVLAHDTVSYTTRYNLRGESVWCRYGTMRFHAPNDNNDMQSISSSNNHTVAQV